MNRLILVLALCVVAGGALAQAPYMPLGWYSGLRMSGSDYCRGFEPGGRDYGWRTPWVCDGVEGPRPVQRICVWPGGALLPCPERRGSLLLVLAQSSWCGSNCGEPGRGSAYDRALAEQRERDRRAGCDPIVARTGRNGGRVEAVVCPVQR